MLPKVEFKADMTPEEALAGAVRAIGGYAASARVCGLKTAWAVQKWKRCPPPHVKAIVLAARQNAYAVSPHDLQPAIYPDGFEFPADEAAAA